MTDLAPEVPRIAVKGERLDVCVFAIALAITTPWPRNFPRPSDILSLRAEELFFSAKVSFHTFSGSYTTGPIWLDEFVPAYMFLAFVGSFRSPQCRVTSIDMEAKKEAETTMETRKTEELA